LTSVPERNIQIELYRIIKNLITQEFSSNNIELTGVKFEPTINGRPDLVIEAIEKGKKLSLLVIETKRKVPFVDRKFDPYSKDVIRQASGYAVELGAPYFATCNGDVFVLFDTFTAGVPLPQRRLNHYKVSFDEEFARTILEEVCKLRTGLGKWLELDDIFLQRLRTFHTFITPFILKSLNQQLRDDLKFKGQYVKWLRSQLFEYSPKMNETIAEQLAYMLMNRLTFYKTLETQISSLTKLTKIDTEDSKVFSARLREVFDKVCKDVDYEAIFEPHSVLDRFLLPKKLIYTLNDFIEELGTYDLSKIRSDVIGRVYEELIPEAERHRLGQYYTPPPIIELITEMCIKSPNDRVLDPACGSGGFLVKAYHKLKDLKKKENPFAEDDKLHEEILNQIYGIDINPFPAQLSSINLAVRNLKVASRNINLVVSDFFKVKPSTGIIPKKLNVIVTNPPYTRQEEMEYKDQIREEALTYLDGSKIYIGAQAGIYAYFFTHSAKFLENKGRMGYITSTSWLEADFGKDLQKFFLDHFKILAIIAYQKRVFEKAAVNTVVVILEKADGKGLQEERENNLARFVKLKQPMRIENITDFIESAEKDYDTTDIKIVVKKQKHLSEDTKWSKYLNAPKVYFKLLENPKMTRLKEIAEIKRGVTTGANPFFILDKEKSAQWGVEESYLKPCIKSTQEAICIDFEEKDVKYYLLTVHSDKQELRKRGHFNVLSYIEYGEKEGFNRRRTTENRKLWYDLGDLKPAPLLSTLNIWQRHLVLRNKADVLATHNLYEIRPKIKNADALLGILNSSLTELFMEIHGRGVLGEGALAIMVYEMANLPILNPKEISNADQDKMNSVLVKLIEAQRKNDKVTETELKRNLDKIVFNTLGLNSREEREIYEGLESLKQMRFQRKEVNVLVETAEKWKPHKKPKKEKISKLEPSKRLDRWIKPE